MGRPSIRLAASIFLLLIAGLAQELSAQLPSTPAPSQFERFATFLNGDGYSATLILQNITANETAIATPHIILNDTEFTLDKITLPPHSSSTVDLSAAMAAHGREDKRGTVAVQYALRGYGGLTTVTESSNEKKEIYLLSYGQARQEYWAGNAFDAVLWTPDQGTQGFITVTNTGSEARLVHPSYMIGTHTDVQPPVQVGPRQTVWIAIDDLAERSRKNGASVRLQFDGYPGDIVAEGHLVNTRTGFSKALHFMNASLKYPTGTLRSHFLLLGQQSADDSFPSQVSFSSIAALHNIDAKPVQVTPKVRFLSEGSVRSVSLSPVTLDVNDTKLIDLSAAQRSGEIPADVHHASLELVPADNHSFFAGELFNFDSGTTRYVIGPSFTSYPTHGVGSVWRTDGTFQTSIVVENTGTEADTVVLKVYWDGGSYIKAFPIGAGDLLNIDLRQLQQDAIPDDSGNQIVGTSGVVSLVGSLGIRSRLSFDKLIHSADRADYVGLPPNPCDYILGGNTHLDAGSNPYPVINEYQWVQGADTSGDPTNPGTNNAWIIQIVGNSATLTPIDNQAHSALIGSGGVVVQNCDACSAGEIFPTESSVTVPAQAVVSCPTVTRGATGTCSVSGGQTPSCSNWSFSDGTNTVQGPASGCSWGGTLVKGGTVSVTITDGNRSFSASATITVNARNWHTAAATATKVANGTSPLPALPVPPQPTGSDSGLGFFAENTSDQGTSNSTIIQSGPNTNYTYFASQFSISTTAQYEINPDLEDANSTFSAHQCGNYNASKNPGGFISRASLLTQTQRHEYNSSTQSHYAFYSNSLSSSGNNPGDFVEQQVAPPGADLNAFVQNVRNGLNSRYNQIGTDTSKEPFGVNSTETGTFLGNINYAPYTSCQ
jgi:hypothetical protein